MKANRMFSVLYSCGERLRSSSRLNGLGAAPIWRTVVCLATHAGSMHVVHQLFFLRTKLEYLPNMISIGELRQGTRGIDAVQYDRPLKRKRTSQ